jgi:UDPglucose 6-dehydrogenase
MTTKGVQAVAESSRHVYNADATEAYNALRGLDVERTGVGMATKKGIAVVGSGYVGTVMAACLAELGHTVIGVEIDADKVASLNGGSAPFFEAQLDDLISSGIDSGRLVFTDDYQMAMDQTEIVFLCVDTPPGTNGHPNMTSVAAAAESIGAAIRDPHIIVTKSTVPVGSGNWLEATIGAALAHGVDPDVVDVVSNPEFLREGSAVHDFMHPDRIVVGGDSEASVEKVAAVYERVLSQSFEGGDPTRKPALIKTGRATAETIKYAANAFLATKISFINEIANICEWLDADVVEVAHAIGLDDRIGPRFLNAGVGWGGSCFGKDTAALASMAREQGIEPLILDAVRRVNTNQRHTVVRKLQHHLRPLRGRRVTLLGLAFKPGTDDTRDAPAHTIIRSLEEKGVILRASDPMVTELAGAPDIAVYSDPYEAICDADAVVLLTEWQEFLDLDYRGVAEIMRGNVIIDGRNALDPEAVMNAGLTYEAIGRFASRK